MIDWKTLSDRPNVALFVHVSNTMSTLEHTYQTKPDVPELADGLRNWAESYGNVVASYAYYDWTNSEEYEARDWRRHQIEPVLVLSKENGTDRTEVVMSMDIVEHLNSGNVDIVLLVTGDTSFFPAVLRIRRAGKVAVVCGGSTSTGHELQRGAHEFVSLESLWQQIEENIQEEFSPDTYDWSKFLSLVARLEARLPYVGVRYLVRKAMTYESVGFRRSDIKELIYNTAKEREYIIEYEHYDLDGETKLACRLNRDSQLVSSLISSGDIPDPTGMSDSSYMA